MKMSLKGTGSDHPSEHLEEKDKFKKKDIDKAIDYLKDSQKPEAEFSSTAIDYISQFNVQLN